MRFPKSEHILEPHGYHVTLTWPHCRSGDQKIPGQSTSGLRLFPENWQGAVMMSVPSALLVVKLNQNVINRHPLLAILIPT